MLSIACIVPTTADEAYDCPDEAPEEVCEALELFESTFALYADALDAAETIYPYALTPLDLSPRLAAANGQLATAVLAVIDMYGQERPEAQFGYGFGSPFTELSQTTWDIVGDPLPPAQLGNLDALDGIDLEQAGTWALLAAARAQAAGGFHERARALFLLAADQGHGPLRFGAITPPEVNNIVFMIWAASGFVDDALAYTHDWNVAPAGYAALAIAEGLALGGDVAATRGLVATLPGDLPLLGAPAIAEALRRSGNPEAAHETLDSALATIDAQRPALFDYSARKRFIMGYALLGDMETMRNVAGWRGEEGQNRLLFWRLIAPLVACHDLAAAIDLLDEHSILGTRPTAAWDLVDTLVAASAAGQGKAALDIAKGRESLVDRTLLLTAVVIGLRQAQDIPDDALACTFLSAVRY